MKTIRTILYATDFSASSVPAGEYALTLARMAGARLHVLHVIGELADNRRNMIQPEAFDLFEKEVERLAVKEMDAFCARHFPDGENLSSEIVVGVPFQEILRRAGSLPADMVVLGTHGRTGLEHVLVGSTAERVMRRSAIPVLTVRSEE